MKIYNLKLGLLIITFLTGFLLTTLPLSSKETPLSSYKAKITLSEHQERVNWQWWENFKDTTLLDSLKNSVDNSFDVLIADLKTEEAQNYFKSVQRNRAPFISAGASFLKGKSSKIDYYGRTRFITNTQENIVYLPLEFNYELDFWGRKKDERAFWAKNKNFAEFEKNFVILSTVSQVSSFYFNILRNEKLISLYKEILSLKQQKLAINLEKFDLRLIGKQKIINIKKELSFAKEDLTNLRAKNEDLKNQFYFLVSGNKERCSVIFKNLDDIKLFYDNDLEISSIQVANRPDVLMAEEQIRMAKLDAKLARKALFPKFVLTGDIYQISQMFNNFLSSESFMYMVGEGVVFDFFRKGKNHAEHKAKKNLCEQALKEYEKVIVSSINDVNNSLFYLKSSIKNYKQAQEVSSLDRRNMDIEKEKLEMSLSSYDEYIEAEERFINSKIEEYTSKTECLIHTISLYKALGGNV